MSPRSEFWIVIIVLAVGTYLQRSVPIWLHRAKPLPAWAERPLRRVPAAALTALVVPGALYLKSAGVYHLAPARTIAALVALVVALRWRNMAAPLVVGMAALWIAQAVLG